MGRTNAELGVRLVTDAQIARLNKRYRGKVYPTDVLSFPIEPKILLGDVVISLPTAARQAREKKHSLRQECLVLLVHGILHLLGYDHQTERDYRRMHRRELALLGLLTR